MSDRNRLRSCVCRIVRTPALSAEGVEMIIYSWLCPRGNHGWYASQKSGIWWHDYRPIP